MDGFHLHGGLFLSAFTGAAGLSAIERIQAVGWVFAGLARDRDHGPCRKCRCETKSHPFRPPRQSCTTGGPEPDILTGWFGFLPLLWLGSRHSASTVDRPPAQNQPEQKVLPRGYSRN